MAVITSNVTGTTGTPALWSATGTWVGGVVPIIGTDTASIAAGANVIVDAAACTASVLVVGIDPATGGAAAITIGTSAQTSETNLYVDTGLTLQLKGDLTIVGQNSSGGAFSRLTLKSGASLVMNPKSGAIYKFNFSYLAEIISNGATNTGVWPDTTGGNHCIIKTDLARNASGQAIPVFLGGVPNTQTVWGGFTTHTFTEFSNIGNATIFGVVWVQPNLDLYGYHAKAITMTNCTFNACNYWASDDGSAAYWTGNYLFDDNLFSASVACSQFGFSGCAGFTLHTDPGSATREIRRNAFDIAVNIDGTTNIFFQGNVFGQNIVISGATTWSSDSMFADNVIVTNQNSTTTGIFPSLKNCYIIHSDANPTGYIKVKANATVTDCIFEAGVAFGDSAACIYQGTAGTCTIKNCMTVGQFTNSGSGYLVHPQGGSGFNYVVEHNLMWGAVVRGMIALGEGGAAAAGQVISCRANICYASTIPGGDFVYAIDEAGSSTFTVDAVTVAGYNGFFTPSTGSNKHGATTQTGVTGYKQLAVTDSAVFPNAEIGTGDFTADPTFVDSTRIFKKWGNVTQGSALTVAGALAKLLANPALITLASTGLMPWVKAGYVPTNATYLHATYAGDTATTGADGRPLNGTVGPLGIQVPLTIIPFPNMPGALLAI